MNMAGATRLELATSGVKDRNIVYFACFSILLVPFASG